MKRSEFIFYMASIPFWGILSSCKESPVGPLPDESREILLTANPKENAIAIQKKCEKITDVVDKNESLTLKYQADAGLSTLVLTQQVNRAADYPHIVIRKDNNETADILWGWKGFSPTIRLADSSGNTLVVHGKKLEFAVASQISYQPQANRTSDLLSSAMKVLGYALSIWLGATVLKYVVAAIAYVAFNTVALAFILIAGSLAYKLLLIILEYLGWSRQDVLEFVRQTWDRILELMSELLGELDTVIQF
ncbi:MAG: hypothetical protein AMXMBFR49_25800 [Chlorobiota bacterium]